MWHAALCVTAAAFLVAAVSSRHATAATTGKVLKQSKIIGGADDFTSAYIAQVYRDYNTHHQLDCSGTAVSYVHIVTAGHCITDPMATKAVPASRMSVVYGYTTVSSKHPVMKVTHAHLHPKFNIRWHRVLGKVADYDVSVVRVEGLLHGIHLSLAPRGKGVAAGLELMVSAWGATGGKASNYPMPGEMRSSVFETTDRATCSKLLKGAELSPGVSCILETSDHAVCFGDSGAGVYDENRHILWGVISSGACGANPASMFVDVTHPKVWDWLHPFTKCTSC